jgi:hypothetical protein
LFRGGSCEQVATIGCAVASMVAEKN